MSIFGTETSAGHPVKKNIGYWRFILVNQTPAFLCNGVTIYSEVLFTIDSHTRYQCFYESSWSWLSWTLYIAVFKISVGSQTLSSKNLGRSGKLSFFVIYKFWQNYPLVRQVSDLILKTDIVYISVKICIWLSCTLFCYGYVISGPFNMD